MRIDIWSDGDSSVGIPGCSATIDMEPDFDLIDREELRGMISTLFSEIFDEQAKVMFEDEDLAKPNKEMCPDCDVPMEPVFGERADGSYGEYLQCPNCGEEN